MTEEERNKEISTIFNLTISALKSELTNKEGVSDKTIAVALKFLATYEVDRLPVPGEGVEDEEADVPFPISASG